MNNQVVWLLEPSVTDPTDRAVDRERDVLVTSFDVRIKLATGRRLRAERGAPWNVFLGPELIERFDDRDDAIQLARMVSSKSRRPAWISTDGMTFEAIDRM